LYLIAYHHIYSFSLPALCLDCLSYKIALDSQANGLILKEHRLELVSFANVLEKFIQNFPDPVIPIPDTMAYRCNKGS